MCLPVEIRKASGNKQDSSIEKHTEKIICMHVGKKKNTQIRQLSKLFASVFFIPFV